MAIGWMAVLQMVPWSDVIKNAPKVADSAKKLWNTVGKKTPPATALPEAGSAVPRSPEAHAMAALQAQVLTLESATEELHEQMLASSELIKALAEQNTQLIRRAETTRVRLLLLAAVTALVAIVAVVALTLGDGIRMATCHAGRHYIGKVLPAHTGQAGCSVRPSSHQVDMGPRPGMSTASRSR